MCFQLDQRFLCFNTSHDLISITFSTQYLNKRRERAKCDVLDIEGPGSVVDGPVPMQPHHLVVSHHVKKAGALLVGEVQIGDPEAPHFSGVQLHVVQRALHGRELVRDQVVDPAQVEHHGNLKVLKHN